MRRALRISGMTTTAFAPLSDYLLGVMRRSLEQQEPMPRHDRDADQETPGLAEPWYLAERCNRECSRGGETSLALLIVETALSEDASLAQWLAQTVRQEDAVAHFGGGRYAVLLLGAGGYDAGRVAARIRERAPRVDIGVAVYPQDGGDLSELVVAALRELPGPFDVSSETG